MIRIVTRVVLATAVLALLAPAAFAGGNAAAGKKTYDMLCFTCHGTTGKGDGPAGAALNPPPRNFTVGAFKFDADGDGTPGSDADLTLIVTNGAGKYGGNPVMAPWGGALKPQQIQDVIAYIRTLKKK